MSLTRRLPWPALNMSGGQVLLCVLLFLARAVPIRGQHLPPPLALGSECGLILSCPWSGPLAAHLSFGGDFYIEDGDHGTVQPLLWAGLDFSGWRWFEGGIRWGVRLNASPHFADQHPLTAWGRLTPQLPDRSVAVALELRADTMLAESGTFYGDAQWYTLAIGYQAKIVRLYAVGSYVEAAHRSVHELQAGTGLSLGIPRIGLALLAEAMSRVPTEAGALPSVTYALGVRIFDRFGVGFKAGYTGSRDASGQAGMPPHAALGHFRFSYGPGYVRDHPDPPQRPDGLMLWFLEHLYGWQDPLVGADGYIYADDGKTKLYRFGVPDPNNPGFIRPFSGPDSVAVGTSVLVHSGDLGVRTTEGGQWLGNAIARGLAELKKERDEDELVEKARRCDYCRPAPMPLFGDGGAGYMVGCAFVRWKGCGLKPWDDPGSPAADPGAWGAVGAGVRAAVRASSPPGRFSVNARGGGPPAPPQGGTYLLLHPDTGQVMRSGRTGNLDKREYQHSKPPETRDLNFRRDVETNDYAEQRGIEQLRHEQYKPPMNKINPISPKNPRREEYLDAGRKKLQTEDK